MLLNPTWGSRNSKHALDSPWWAVNYLAHKKYYCSGLKQQQQQDSDEDSSQQAMASKKPTLPAPASPPFSPTSQAIPVPKQNIFNQEFFLSQKSLLENFPSKMPLLMGGPGAMGLQQPNTSHFVCQGCGIKFKSISNLKVSHVLIYKGELHQNLKCQNSRPIKHAIKFAQE